MKDIMLQEQSRTEKYNIETKMRKIKGGKHQNRTWNRGGTITEKKRIEDREERAIEKIIITLEHQTRKGDKLNKKQTHMHKRDRQT